MTQHDDPDGPEELREHPSDGTGRPRHGLATRVVVVIVVVALILMSVSVWIVTSGMLNLPL